MKLIYKFFIVLGMGIFMSCGTSSKSISSHEQMRKLDEMVSSKSFQIQSDWAMPLMTNSMNSIANAGLLPVGSSGSQISLIGNSNFLMVKGDTISANLPYFGERQMGAGYSSNTNAIQFNGIPENFNIIEDEKRQSKEITFTINNKAESFRVFISLFPNLSSSIIVNSSQRFSIRYRGEVMPIPTE